MAGAVETLTRALDVAPEDPDVLVPLATALEATGEKEQAATLYEKARALAPEHKAASLGAMRAGAETAAAPEIAAQIEEEEAAGQVDDDPVSLETRGDAAFKGGRHFLAAKLFKKAVDASEGEPDERLLRNLAAAYEASGQPSKAIAAYKRVLQAAPDDGELHYRYAKLLLSAGRRSDGKRALAKTASVDKARWQASFDLGLLEMEDSQHTKAARAFERVLDQMPNHVPALNNLGHSQLQAGDKKGALKTFEALTRAQPSDPNPWLNVAALYQQMSRERDMVSALAQACQRGAQHACK